MPVRYRCVYLGSAVQNGLKCAVVLSIERRKVYYSRNIVCNESEFPFRKANALPAPNPKDYVILEEDEQKHLEEEEQNRNSEG